MNLKTILIGAAIIGVGYYLYTKSKKATVVTKGGTSNATGVPCKCGTMSWTAESEASCKSWIDAQVSMGACKSGLQATSPTRR